ncbi:MAG TPA: hypothetical protein VKE88_04050 [Candidatus Nanoarchaeia archaeon]|nr:hypothetical protein [Candidatus Nanoarchaeia archaeon]
MDEFKSRKLSDGTEIAHEMRELPTYDSILLRILIEKPGISQQDLTELYKKRRSEIDILTAMKENERGATYINLGVPGELERKFKVEKPSGIYSEDTSEDKDLLEHMFHDAKFRLEYPKFNRNN